MIRQHHIGGRGYLTVYENNLEISLFRTLMT
jgi:hypothetical protein